MKKNLLIFLTFIIVNNVKKLGISQIFVAFSEYLNFHSQQFHRLIEIGEYDGTFCHFTSFSFKNVLIFTWIDFLRFYDLCPFC